MLRIAAANRLLESLPQEVGEQLLAKAKLVELNFGEIIWEPSQRIKYVYFPLDSFVSQLYPADRQKNLEVGLVGGEGMLGIPLVLGVNATIMQSMVQGTGSALRLDAATFLHDLEMLPELRLRLYRYIYVVMAQLALTVTCNSFHSLDARLARWLLMSHDRAQLGSFHLTHKFLGQMLGVRRVGVTNAAGRLQRQKVVRYSRGNIDILDREGLEKLSCSCYVSAKDIYERVLG
ncbi:MAG: Crp/Fnr family transcriptional regulator [Woeseia sp.]